MTDLAFASARDLSRMLRARKVSSVELTTYFLDRLEQRAPRYNALAQLTRETALTQARAADRALAKGSNKSPLLGVPFGAKDLLATKGIPTRWGSPAHADQMFDHDATVITKLREAGAPLLGKLAMVEIAGGGGYEFADASANGPGLNPWDVTRWSGGSSSGSGSAVAAGLVPFALGSETWGSIVTPSTFCGVTGLRPSYGLVSRYGAMELAWTLDKVGPMARTAEDCGLILGAIAGRDAHDATVTGEFHFQRKSSRVLRIGILPSNFTDADDARALFESAVRVLRSALRKAGARFGAAPELPIDEYSAVASTLLNAEMAAAQKEFIESDRLDLLRDANQKQGLRASLEVRGSEVVRAQQKREDIRRQIAALFTDYDVLLAPTALIEANPITVGLSVAFKKRRSYSVLGALCGLPALSVPMGFGAHGMPIGLSIIGNVFDENAILQVGMAYQRETDWHLQKPNV